MIGINLTRLWTIAALTAALALATSVSAQSGAAKAVEPTGEATVLSLEAAVSRALTHSPALKQAAAERDAQVERRRGAWADLGPRVSAEYTMARFEDAQTAQFGGQEIVLRPKENKLGSLTVAQPLTGAVALFERARMEGTQEDIKDMSYQLVRGEVAFQAAEAWLKAYQAERQLEIAQASVAAVESQARDAAAMERVGRLNRGDVLKLELAVSEAKARAAQARAGLDVVRAALREAIGLPVNAPIALVKDLPVVPQTLPSETEIYETAKARRLEPKVAEGGVTAAGFGKKLAYTQFSPSVNAFVKWERNFGEVAGLAGEKDTRTYGIQATWDLWNNGAHVFAVREAAELTHKAEAAVRAAESQVRLDVRTAYANLKAAQESLALAKVAVRQAEEAYRIEQARFRTGARSATDVILAETSHTSAQGRLIAAQTDLISWHLKLQKAMGVDQPVKTLSNAR